MKNHDISLDEIFQGIVHLIPSSWQYPNITCTRLSLNDQEFRSENFEKTIWKQNADVFVHGEQHSVIEVYYLEKKPEMDEGPFLKEERDLINAIAERIGNIIELKQLEAALRNYKQIVSTSKEFMAMVDKNYVYEVVNQPYMSMFNKQYHDIVGHSVSDLVGEVWFSGNIKERFDKCLAGETVKFQTWFDFPNNDHKYLDITYYPSMDTNGQISGVVVKENDITGLKQAEEQIKVSLKEKEVLLQEIHHRVKNNMAVISSLLQLQANGTRDEQLKEALTDSQNRVQAMSSIHETLYQFENLSIIDMNVYLRKLAGTIVQGYTIGHKISLKIETANTVIGVKQASPLGMIVSELITNSYKYAFPDSQKGEINISLRKIENQFELIYMDNGVGIPEDFDWRNTKSLGLRLVKLLGEGQLGGSVELNRDQGTGFKIIFNQENINS